MKVLVIGGGAREHALCRALVGDPAITGVTCAPGNAGIAEIAATVPVDPGDVAAITRLAGETEVGLVVIGPEAPLVAGAADALRAAGIACFGPSAAAARLEGSKAFAKDVMKAAGVPTATAVACTNSAQVATALDEFGPPYVVKDDGLAGGKGVLVTEDRTAALAHAARRDRVLVEEYLDGPEVSLFAVTDGRAVLPLAPAQDFKRVGDGDTGPNTGGMGAYSPLPWAPSGLVDEVIGEIVRPTVDEMRRRGTPFAGLLYAGLALTARGVRVLEFNARFGDPETQVVLARLRSPLAGVLLAAATGTLDATEPLEWDPQAAVTVVVAATGYPAAPRSGDVIDGVREAGAVPGAYVLHAGTGRDARGRLVTAGGRVLSITAVGSDLATARRRAYEAAGRIRISGAHYRTDIAAAALRS